MYHFLSTANIPCCKTYALMLNGLHVKSWKKVKSVRELVKEQLLHLNMFVPQKRLITFLTTEKQRTNCFVICNLGCNVQ